MTTLQEQFEKDFPNKSVKGIDCGSRYTNSNFTNWDLDVREYKELTGLFCSSNNLTSLDVSGLSNLTKLDCSYNNNLTSLNVSGCSNLTKLSCCANKLTSLNVSGLSELTEFFFL